MYNKIFKQIRDGYNNGFYTLEQAEELNNLAYSKYVSEGVVKRALAKSNKGTKADTVLKCWAKSYDGLPSIEEAESIIKKLENINSINVEITMNQKILAAMAVTKYPQSKFIRLVKKMDDCDYPKWMLQTPDIEYTDIPELTEKLQKLIDGISDKEKKNSIISKFLLDESKKYGSLSYTYQGHVKKISSKNKVYEKALRNWTKGKYHVICPDGGGNYLVYSIENGKFYDYFHEEDWGTNYQSWLSQGISYKDFMNHFLTNNDEK